MRSRIDIRDVREATERVVSEFPEFWRAIRSRQADRVSEEISWVYTAGGVVVDLGGSSGFHASICAALGMRPICVDNCLVRPLGHTDDFYYQHDMEAQKIARRLGVEFIDADLLSWDPPFPENSIDACMSLDVIEHLHRSPRTLYHSMVRCLTAGGTFLLGGPNAANLLKRFRVPMGKNIFAKFDDWYAHEYFIGHVREPVVSDYYPLANDLRLDIVEIIGRNWLGKSSRSKAKAVAAYVVDKLLVRFPSLCSDIYLLARKPCV